MSYSRKIYAIRNLEKMGESDMDRVCYLIMSPKRSDV